MTVLITTIFLSVIVMLATLAVTIIATKYSANREQQWLDWCKTHTYVTYNSRKLIEPWIRNHHFLLLENHQHRFVTHWLEANSSQDNTELQSKKMEIQTDKNHQKLSAEKYHLGDQQGHPKQLEKDKISEFENDSDIERQKTIIKENTSPQKPERWVHFECSLTTQQSLTTQSIILMPCYLPIQGKWKINPPAFTNYDAFNETNNTRNIKKLSSQQIPTGLENITIYAERPHAIAPLFNASVISWVAEFSKMSIEWSDNWILVSRLTTQLSPEKLPDAINAVHQLVQALQKNNDLTGN